MTARGEEAKEIENSLLPSPLEPEKMRAHILDSVIRGIRDFFNCKVELSYFQSLFLPVVKCLNTNSG